MNTIPREAKLKVLPAYAAYQIQILQIMGKGTKFDYGIIFVDAIFIEKDLTIEYYWRLEEQNAFTKISNEVFLYLQENIFTLIAKNDQDVNDYLNNGFTYKLFFSDNKKDFNPIVINKKTFENNIKTFNQTDTEFQSFLNETKEKYSAHFKFVLYQSSDEDKDTDIEKEENINENDNSDDLDIMSILKKHIKQANKDSVFTNPFFDQVVLKDKRKEIRLYHIDNYENKTLCRTTKFGELVKEPDGSSFLEIKEEIKDVGIHNFLITINPKGKIVKVSKRDNESNIEINNLTIEYDEYDRIIKMTDIKYENNDVSVNSETVIEIKSENEEIFEKTIDGKKIHKGIIIKSENQEEITFFDNEGNFQGKEVYYFLKSDFLNKVEKYDSENFKYFTEEYFYYENIEKWKDTYTTLYGKNGTSKMGITFYHKLDKKNNWLEKCYDFCADRFIREIEYK